MLRQRDRVCFMPYHYTKETIFGLTNTVGPLPFDTCRLCCFGICYSSIEQSGAEVVIGWVHHTTLRSRK